MSGLALGVRGIVRKEARSRTRGWRPMLVLTVYLLILTFCVVAVLAVTVSTSGTISPTMGALLFDTLAGGSVVLVAFIAPALTAGAISGERERLTLDLLLVTRASALGLVTGKLAGALLWVLYLLVASFPALGIVYLFGGVPIQTVLAALTVTISTALAYSSLALMLSVLFRRTAIATVLAYGLVVVTMIALPIISAYLGVLASNPQYPLSTLLRSPEGLSFGWPPASAWLSFFSPVWAFVSVVGGQFGQVQSLPSASSVVAVYTSRAAATVGTVDTASVWSLAAWVFNALVSVGIAVISVLLAAVWLSPRRLPRKRARGG